MIMKKIEDLKKQLGGEKEKSPGRAISDLHTVNENYDDENDEDDMEAIDPNLNPNKFVRSKGEYEDHVAKVVETSVIINEIKEYIQKTQKVKNFLIMVVHRRRFLKRRAGIRLLQRYMKGYLSWKDARKELREERDFKKVEALKFFIRKASDVQRDRLDQAAQKIQRSIWAKIKKRNLGRQLRKELIKLPIVVRPGFVKMYFLKNQTSALNR